MTTAETIEQAGKLLAAAAPPDSKVILFGSRARGDAHDDSDYDFLIIEPTIDSKPKEMVRLRMAINPLQVPADVIVMRRAYVEEWGDVPGTMLYDALREGRVLAET